MNRRTRTGLLAALGAVALLGSAVGIAAPQNRSDCIRLANAAAANTASGETKVTSAEWIEPPYVATWDEVRGAKETVTVPFCLVRAQGKTVPGSDVRIEVWLPDQSNWNGRLLGVGGSRSTGSVNTLDVAMGINRGFAGVSTDNGHHGYAATDISWALGHPERIADFGYRAHHLGNEMAKALIQSFYRRAVAHSYFYGCSQGGFLGMIAAQRYPADYDGIVAGAPVYNWADEMTSQAWNYRALTATRASGISPKQMAAIYAESARQCGGPDGLIADPRQCRLDVRRLACAAKGAGGSAGTVTGAECLTPEQQVAVKKMYTGPSTAAGAVIGPGLTPGSEAAWAGLWDVSTGGPTNGGSWLGTFRNMVFDDPNWDPAMLNFDRDPEFARRKVAGMLDAGAVNLEAFSKRGGKLIVYHGWADQMVPARSSTDYYSAVVSHSSARSVDAFLALFMVPGMGHCGGGPGAGEVLHTSDTPEVPLTPDHDVIAAVTQWVEQGQAPAHLVALKADASGKVSRSRLLCPEPQKAVYRGSGDVLDANSWRCSKVEAADAAPKH